jgi:hypothetical protein
MNEGSEKRKNMNIRFKLLATALAACLASGYTAAQTIQIASNVQANETSSDAKLINAARLWNCIARPPAWVTGMRNLRSAGCMPMRAALNVTML